MTTNIEKNKTLTTPIIQPLLLRESRASTFKLEEDVNTGKLIVRGECARAGVPTENGRVYTAKLWEKCTDKLKKSLKERKVLGALNHPKDGRTDLNDVTHVVTDLYLNEEGILIGEFEIIPTDKGRNLAAIIRAGCPVGVSSRGYGSTIRNERGEDIVQEDYTLVTFDFVADPADSNAYPQVISEGKQLIFEGKEIEMSIGNPDVEQEQKLAAKWAQQIQNETKAETPASGLTNEEKEKLKKEVMDKLAEMKSEIYDQVKKELLSDPSVAGAKTALESIKAALKPYMTESIEPNEEITALKNTLAEKEKVISALKEDISQAGQLVKKFGFRYVMEQALSGNEDAELIKKAVGDVQKFESVEALKEGIDSIKTELNAKKEKQRVLAEKQEKIRAAERLQESQLRQHIAQLEEANEKALKAHKETALMLYASEQVRHHPQSNKIMALVESLAPQSKDEINKIISQFDMPRRDAEQMAQVRANARQNTRGAYSTKPIDEELAPKKTSRAKMVEGLDLNEFRSIAGLGN